MALTRSRRRFSKWTIVANMLLAWVFLFYSVSQGPATAALVVVPVIGLLTTQYGIYVGVGHLDFRKLLTSMKDVVQ